MGVNFAPSSANNSSISPFIIDDLVARFTNIEISDCRSSSGSTASLEIPSNRYAIKCF